jgi:hypothetical protein
MNSQKENSLAAALTAAVAPLGFSADVPVPLGNVDIAFWFSRVRDRMTEAIGFRVKWQPDPIMVANCLVSKYSLPELARRGVEGNADGQNLYQYQIHFLDRDDVDLLPHMIPMDPKGDDWEKFARGIAGRLAAELQSVETSIWTELRSS